jgi:hypothetical protein
MIPDGTSYSNTTAVPGAQLSRGPSKGSRLTWLACGLLACGLLACGLLACGLLADFPVDAGAGGDCPRWTVRGCSRTSDRPRTPWRCADRTSSPESSRPRWIRGDQSASRGHQLGRGGNVIATGPSSPRPPTGTSSLPSLDASHDQHPTARRSDGRRRLRSQGSPSGRLDHKMHAAVRWSPSSTDSIIADLKTWMMLV